MSEASVIVVCEAPHASCWELGSLRPSRGKIVLLAWEGEARSVDAEVPPPVVRTLCDALTDIARVTFVTPSDLDPPVPLAAEDQSIPIVPTGGWAAIIRRWSGNAPTSMLSTLHSSTLALMFDDPGWFLQGQLAILSDPSAPVPELDGGMVAALTGDDWLEGFAASDLAGVLRPGVDGDVVGLALADADMLHRFVEKLRQRATYHSVSIELRQEWELRAPA